MNNNSHKRINPTATWSAAAMAIALTLPQALWADRDVNETRAMDADGFINLKNTAGSVEVIGWEREQLQITGTLDDKVEKLEISATGNGYRIEVKHPRRSRSHDDTDLVLRVPTGASVEIETVSAEISVSSIEGERTVAHSVSGDLEIDIGSDLADLATVSGDISYRGSSGRTRTETVSGDIEIRGVSDELTVNTVSGDVEVSGSAIRDGRFESVSGDLELAMGLSGDARVVIESLSGEVVVLLPRQLSARLEASSFSGSIDTDFGRAEKSRYGSEKRFETVLGDGQGQIRIESFSGDIELKKAGDL